MAMSPVKEFLHDKEKDDAHDYVVKLGLASLF
jgi:hypothetical protein